MPLASHEAHKRPPQKWGAAHLSLSCGLCPSMMPAWCPELPPVLSTGKSLPCGPCALWSRGTDRWVGVPLFAHQGWPALGPVSWLIICPRVGTSFQSGKEICARYPLPRTATCPGPVPSHSRAIMGGGPPPWPEGGLGVPQASSWSLGCWNTRSPRLRLTCWWPGECGQWGGESPALAHQPSCTPAVCPQVHVQGCWSPTPDVSP